jgi:outer membrane protein TolC
LPASQLKTVEVSFAGISDTPPELSAVDLRREALLNRTDVLAALATYAACEAALQLEIAKQYPDVRVSPGYKYDQGENEWSLGLSVDLPIGHQNQGPIAEAEARRAEVGEDFKALQARIIADLDRSIAVYVTGLAKVGTADRLQASQVTQVEAARSRLEAGDISRLELSAVELELDKIAVARLRALAQAQQAFGALENALQRPVLTAHFLPMSPILETTTLKDPEHD